MYKTQTQVSLEHNSRLGNDEESESYSSNSSIVDSYSDSSDLANWEEYVADNGAVFYAEYMPQMKKQSNASKKCVEFARSSSKRMMGKNLTRRQYQQQRRQTAKTYSEQQQNQSEKLKSQLEKHVVKFSDIKSFNHIKQLELVITAADRYRFGRRSTAVESILGFRVVPFPDQPECLMIDSFVHEMPTMQQQEQIPIKRGDWFRALDNIDIRTSNVDELLFQFVEPTKVCLKFQGAHAEEDTSSNSLAEDVTNFKIIENFSTFAEQFEYLVNANTEGLNINETTCDPQPFAFLLLPPECYQNDDQRDSIYFYPENPNTNFLYKTRGSFLTLNAVLTEELQTKPNTSKILVGNIQYYVNYRVLNGFLILFAFSADIISLPESSLRSNELLSYMRFAFPNLRLDNLASSTSSSIELKKFLNHFFKIQQVRLLAIHKKNGFLFEELFKETRHLPLPKEAQLRIFDAMSEMEAMDYRTWNTDPLNTYREFFIYGCVLYYDQFFLASQMPVEMRLNIDCFLRCRGIFDFITKYYVKELYIWEEITLPNLPGRYFLAVCSRNHLILSVILKMFDAPDIEPNAKIAPSLFYIEEIQETLDHLIRCGIESLAMFWSLSNKRPELLDKIKIEVGTEKDSSRLESFIKHKLTMSSSAINTHSQREDESYLCSSFGGSSVQSEDDGSKKCLISGNTGDDSDSESDWENFCDQNPLHCGLEPESQTQMSESLWKEINNVIPVKISAGWKNSVFYYVYIDNANDSIFCPMKANSDLFPFVKEMRKICFLIRNVLQNAKNIKKFLSHDTPKSNSGMLAIKEHSITMQIHYTNGKSEELIKAQFVVVGRLFLSPMKEVYVCHQTDVPQNMVEMAFRLSFFSVG